MRGASLKLSFLVVVLLAFTSSEASDDTNHKNWHHHGRHPPVLPPQTPTPAPVLAPTPAPALAPTPDVGVPVPPYQIHGCGYPCNDSNDCDWPCAVCCANQTCCSDEPFFPPTPSLAPSPASIIEAPTTAPTPEPFGSFGYPCVDSRGCDWPRLVCGENFTCVYNKRFPQAPVAPDQGSCGVLCIDRNECSAPCTECAYGICVYEETCGWGCEDSSECFLTECSECCNECCPDKTCCKKEALPPTL